MPRSRSTHQDLRARRRQIITYAFGVGAFVLFVNALVGDNGYLAVLRTNREHAEATDRLQKVNLENRQLEEQVRRMNEDPSALEEEARRLGLIKEGETIVIYKDAKPAAPPPAPPARK